MIDLNALVDKPPYEALVDQFNFYNQTNIAYGSVRFSSPIPLNGGAQTQITATMAACVNYSGAVTFTYYRLAVATFFANVPLYLPLILPATTNDVLNALQDYVDFYVGPDDFIVQTLPEGTTTYTLQANPNSLRWVGGFQFNIMELEPLPLEPEGCPIPTLIWETAEQALPSPYLNHLNF